MEIMTWLVLGTNVQTVAQTTLEISQDKICIVCSEWNITRQPKCKCDDEESAFRCYAIQWGTSAKP